MNAIRSGKSAFQVAVFLFGTIPGVLFPSSAYPEYFIKNGSPIHTDSQTTSKESVISTPMRLPYFPKIYTGLGIDHMNINLVSLKLTGLLAGDEIGVFDGLYCVGAIQITEKHLIENGVSIPSSANDNLGNGPNGYIQGHKITLKVYRAGNVYQLFFQTVNNTQDIFEKGGSMFALVDFSRSTGQILKENSERIKIYPNPFTDYLKIDIEISNQKRVNISILDISGKLIRVLFEGLAEGQVSTSWDGKDNQLQTVPSGIYFCKVNQTIYGIIYQGIKVN